MLQALLNHGTLVIPDPGCPAGEVVDLMHQASTDCASATPSYWRRLLLLADRARLRQIPLTQITLGGEVCDQQILDGLAETFPHARIAHIYATTELGRCFSVTDGRAGFPASYLDQPTPDGVELRVEDSQLLARSANAMHGYQSDRFKENNTPLGSTWFPTGDLVHIDQQRVYFAGRASEMINVGGNKVQPLMVENIIRALPEVADVRVYAKPSSIAGQLVACEVVACPGMESEAIQQAVANACSQRLAAFQRPRFIEVVDQIHLTGAGKTVRRND